MNDETLESKSVALKFRALKERLDWQGNVVEDIQEKDYVWEGYDPKKFLDSVVRNGDLSSVHSPFGPGECAADAYVRLFSPECMSFNSWDELRKCKTVESVPFNGCKFVIYDRSNSSNEMRWTMED